jgi:hypothetical protein
MMFEINRAVLVFGILWSLFFIGFYNDPEIVLDRTSLTTKTWKDTEIIPVA